MKVVVRHPQTAIQANYRVASCRSENIEKHDTLNERRSDFQHALESLLLPLSDLHKLTDSGHL